VGERLKQAEAAVAVLERERDEQETYADSLREKWDHNLAARGEGLLREKHLRERVRVLEARQAPLEAVAKAVRRHLVDPRYRTHVYDALRVLDADADTPTGQETP
jgi:hypothetical protein